MMKKRERILWVDDEIDLLRPYLIFLSEKGYDVATATNGIDAIEMCSRQAFDMVFLDENMPGLSGLEVLAVIKQQTPNMPVVIITKSEEENIMDLAIGNKIADYLIKPVNPNQILMTLKKHLHKREILTEQTTSGYRTEFGQIDMQISESLSAEQWLELYRRLVYWDITLDEAESELHDLLEQQKAEANGVFAKFIKNNYHTWFEQPDSRPIISPDLFKKRIFPLLDNGDKVFLVVLDNFRYDQWKLIQELLGDFFTFESEELYYAILPTATQYARNAIFSGLMPLQIKEKYPNLWVEEEEETGKNLHEEALIATQLERFRRKETFFYTKINHSQACEKLIEQLPALEHNPLNVCVMNFIDILSHARTDSKMIRELASTEKAYRALAVSWFKNTSVFMLFKELAGRGFKVVVTTDHGTTFVTKPIKVVADKSTNVNLRYKVSKAITYNRKDVYEVLQPAQVGLPSPNISSAYIFATKSDFFVYPNNYNYHANYYKNTFQHGGISMEEMMTPLVVMSGKNG
ncbi:MAG: PglZ domain-containing protein [Prevotellaceae bacterium]|nr:PglZ domain-containing protein [Prevotellaceae bacterium]